jgi:hypothetical protein
MLDIHQYAQLTMPSQPQSMLDVLFSEQRTMRYQPRSMPVGPTSE